ncbi:MAG: hypothetical protein U0984_05330 [Prosthecobacter sp.]|nr:hypothetical protein [Prosthecobacter sp.]
MFAWPYRTWKESIESSRLGASPMDLKTLRFWKRVAIWGPIMTAVIAAGLVAWAVLH